METSDKENPSSDNAEVVNQEATDAYEGATNIAENYDASQVHSIQEYVPSQGYGVRQRMVVSGRKLLTFEILRYSFVLIREISELYTQLDKVEGLQFYLILVCIVRE